MTDVQRSADPMGRCCYGGQKPKSACASCAAWQPLTSKEIVAELRAVDNRPDLAQIYLRHLCLRAADALEMTGHHDRCRYGTAAEHSAWQRSLNGEGSL